MAVSPQEVGVVTGAALDIQTASTNYSSDVAIDEAMRVERTIEDEIVEGLVDEHRWPRVIVGDAGTGKSTLLWSIACTLSRSGQGVPVLLPATWLLRTDIAGPADYLVRGVSELAETLDARVIVMLDTVDLLLHDEQSRQILRRAIGLIEQSGFAVLCATRPHEAALLGVDSVRRHLLSSYDDAELPAAVTALAVRYCAGMSPEKIVADVAHATARGLPAADVCRSPLLVRILFELSAPAIPALADMDTTQLFRSYWQRRIVRDARTDLETHFRPAADANFADAAQATALGLLSFGLPELPAADFTTALTAAGALSIAQIDEGVEVLSERGVLTVTGARRGFFHQTMFEFAAAMAVLSRWPATTLAALTHRTTKRDGDLFVGCVLEQALILGGSNPALRRAIVASTSQLSESTSDAIQSIALVAWAHHPACLTDSRRRLRQVGVSAIVRAVHHIPAIATKPVGESISQLLVIGEVRTEAAVSIAVLEAMTRLAYRHPDQMAQALDHLDLVAAVTSAASTLEFENAVRTVLGAVAADSPTLVRRVLVAMLTNATSRAHIALDYLAELWPAIGSTDLFSEVSRVVDDLDAGDHHTAYAFGRLLFHHWTHHSNPITAQRWLGITDRIVHQPEGSFVFFDEAQMVAVGDMITATTDAAVIDQHLQLLTSTVSATGQTILTTHVLPALAATTGTARDRLTAHAAQIISTIAWGAPDREVTDPARLIVDLMRRSQLPNQFVADVLPPTITAAQWLSDDLLIPITPLAADVGIVSALDALRQPKPVAGSDNQDVLDRLYDSPSGRTPQTEALFERLLQTALTAGLTHRATALMTVASQRGRGWVDPHTPAVLERCRELLSAQTLQDREAGANLLASLMTATTTKIAWPELRRALDIAGGTQALPQLIKGMWLHTSPEDVDEQIGYLTQLIDVVPGRIPPIERRPGIEVAAAAAAVEAWLRIAAMRAAPQAANWEVTRILGCYDLEATDMIVLGTKFAAMMHYITRVGQTSAPAAASMLIDYLEAVAQARFFGINIMLWRRDCGEAVRAASGHHPAQIGSTLIGLCTTLDNEIATVVLDELAAQFYGVVRDDIIHLSREVTDGEVRNYALDLIRSHDRREGTLAFPEILAGPDTDPPLSQLEKDIRERREALKKATGHAYRTLKTATGQSADVLAGHFFVSPPKYRRLADNSTWRVPDIDLCRRVDAFGRQLGLDEFGLTRHLEALVAAEERKRDRDSHVRREQ